MSIEEFKTPFEIQLDKRNRWVTLADMIPWDNLAGIYCKNLSTDRGAPTVDARIVIGAMIIKHKLGLDDRETIETIRENVYMQYFLGLSNYTYDDVFDRSLFTALRYRMGAEKFDAMSCELIKSAEEKKSVSKKSTSKEKDPDENNPPAEKEEPEVPPKNKGKLLLDATVADQMIVYPTDLGLLARSREESERLIDILCKKLGTAKKPRTYRKKARKLYLNVAKMKHKTRKQIHKAIGQQLRFLQRNLKYTHKLLDQFQGQEFPLKKRDQKIFFVIPHIFDQQMQMYKTGANSIEHRIVNIYQPYVRPIVRGKDKSKV